jgi:hypothetical protein
MSFISKRHVPRRLFLKASGVTLALPLLEAMVPARTALAQTAAAPKQRFASVFFPHGMAPGFWEPAAEGALPARLPYILEALGKVKDKTGVLCGLVSKSAEARALGSPPGTVTVTGLLRKSEPHGGFLRANDPEAGRWYSRDVAAIATSRRLAGVAPFFLDADGTPNPGGFPVGGLTVVRFRNAHLVYALTWFALSGLSAFGALLVLRRPGSGRPGRA